MGWSSTPLYLYDNFVDSKGVFNRKEFLDHEWNTQTNEAQWKILKSSMVGTTWYAAIDYHNFLTEEHKVFAMIIITNIEHDEFWYKEMSEEMGPYQYKCPVGILNLLSPTENEYALQWRENCNLMRMAKNQRATFFKLANVGKRKIKYILPKSYEEGYEKGEIIWLSKYHQWNKRSRKEKWVWSDGRYRWPKKMIDHTCCEIFEEDGKTPVLFACVDIESV